MSWSRDREPSTNPGHRNPARPEPSRESMEFRHGLMMRELAELRGRVEQVERTVYRASIRPRVKTAGLSTAVAGAVVGALELLRYVGIFK